MKDPPALKVGVFVYSQGQAQSCCGDATSNIVRMIQDEAGRTGGILVGGRKTALRIFPVEIENRAEEAVNSAFFFINQKNVQVLIGPQHSGDAIPVGEIAQRAGVLMISPMSTNPETTSNKSKVFRIGFLDNFQGDILAKFAFDDLNVRRAAILYNKAKPYSRGIAGRFTSQFTDLGGTIAASETYVTGQEDFSGQLSAIKAAGAQLILLPNHNNDVLLQGPQVRDLGIDAILLGTDAWNELQLASMPAFEGAYKISHWSETVGTEANRNFIREYQNLFGITPNSTAALTYDAFKILFAAAAMAGSPEPSELGRALYALPPFSGLSGTIDYTVSGDPVKSAFVLKFESGKIAFQKLFKP